MSDVSSRKERREKDIESAGHPGLNALGCSPLSSADAGNQCDGKTRSSKGEPTGQEVNIQGLADGSR